MSSRQTTAKGRAGDPSGSHELRALWYALCGAIAATGALWTLVLPWLARLLGVDSRSAGPIGVIIEVANGITALAMAVLTVVALCVSPVGLSAFRLPGVGVALGCLSFVGVIVSWFFVGFHPFGIPITLLLVWLACVPVALVGATSHLARGALRSAASTLLPVAGSLLAAPFVLSWGGYAMFEWLATLGVGGLPRLDDYSLYLVPGAGGIPPYWGAPSVWSLAAAAVVSVPLWLVAVRGPDPLPRASKASPA